MKTNFLICAFLFLISTQVKSQSHVWAVTQNGGAFSQGAIIICNNNGTGLNIAHSFQSPAGFHPYGNLLAASDGNLYGTCYDGGTFGSCTIFRLIPSSLVYTDVVSFDIVHGDYPKSGVVEGPNGKIYGAASAGGSAGGGVIYSYDINTGIYADLFNLTSVTGTVPFGNPIIHSNGKLYGLTTSGGLYSSGVIYCYDIVNNTFTDIYDFDGINGSNPKGSLVESADGTLYGMTSSGGTNGTGVLFSYVPSEGGFAKLYDFTGATGCIPQGTLIQATDGLLYGMTSSGGINSDGVIFSYNPSNSVYTDLHNFNLSDGATPLGKLAQSGNILCGATSAGGTSGLGVMFNFDLTNGTYSKVLDFDGSNNGANPNGGFTEVITTTGIAGISANDHAAVFPNPANEDLNIKLLSNQSETTTFILRDVTGNMVYTSNEKMEINSTKNIDLKGIPAGIYFLEINTETEKVTRKVIKE